ncbi:MAG: hypothetical protein JWR67_3302 [Mucilaginibacter sp.]|nr:hypothetical protein [Mucilaginibacter sp.]
MAAKHIKAINKAGSILLFAFFLSACHQKKQQDADPQQDAMKLAKLVCESRELTHEKFTLAQKYQQLNSTNKIHISYRNADSTPIKLNKVKLDKEKELLIKMSQAKSDSVNHFLKMLWVTKYQTNEQKQQLDDAMTAELKKQCPLAAP